MDWKEHISNKHCVFWMNLCTYCGTEQILNYFFWQATQTFILLWAAPSSTSYFILITHKQDNTRPYEAWKARNNEHRCQRAEVRWIRWDHMVSQATPSAPWMADNLKGKGIPLHFVFTVPYPPNLPWLHFPRSCSLFEAADITKGSSHSVTPLPFLSFYEYAGCQLSQKQLVPITGSLSVAS